MNVTAEARGLRSAWQRGGTLEGVVVDPEGATVAGAGSGSCARPRSTPARSRTPRAASASNMCPPTPPSGPTPRPCGSRSWPWTRRASCARGARRTDPRKAARRAAGSSCCGRQVLLGRDASQTATPPRASACRRRPPRGSRLGLEHVHRDAPRAHRGGRFVPPRGVVPGRVSLRAGRVPTRSPCCGSTYRRAARPRPRARRRASAPCRSSSAYAMPRGGPCRAHRSGWRPSPTQAGRNGGDAAHGGRWQRLRHAEARAPGGCSSMHPALGPCYGARDRRVRGRPDRGEPGEGPSRDAPSASTAHPHRLELALGLVLEAENMRAHLEGWQGAVETDVDGRFRFSGVHEGITGLRAVTPGWTVFPPARSPRSPHARATCAWS